MKIALSSFKVSHHSAKKKNTLKNVENLDGTPQKKCGNDLSYWKFHGDNQLCMLLYGGPIIPFSDGKRLYLGMATNLMV